MAVAVCFDNAFLDVHVEPLRAGPVDFYIEVSNEAWFRHSQEYDQMIAFSRLLAAATGRSIVRATNGGVSALIGPDGVERRRLERGGEDRMVRGTLEIVVPVPTAGAAARRTPFVRSASWWRLGGALLPWILALGLSRRKRYSSGVKG